MCILNVGSRSFREFYFFRFVSAVLFCSLHLLNHSLHLDQPPSNSSSSAVSGPSTCLCINFALASTLLSQFTTPSETVFWGKYWPSKETCTGNGDYNKTLNFVRQTWCCHNLPGPNPRFGQFVAFVALSDICDMFWLFLTAKPHHSKSFCEEESFLKPDSG